MNQRKLFFVLPITALVATTINLVALSTKTQGQEEEIKATKQKIEAMLEKADILRLEGDLDEAEQLVKKAEDLKAQLSKAIGKRKPQQRGEQLEKIIHGLHSGAAALSALDRHEEANKLQQLAAELKNKSKGKGPQRKGESEKDVALKQLEIMRIAQKGLVNAKREDSADLLLRAIRALEVSLEGRRDEEAAKIRKQAPSRGQRAELLMFAARILREANKKEQSNAVAKLGEQMLEQFRARQKRDRKREQRERGGDEHETAANQIRVLQSALVALEEGNRKDAAQLLKQAIQARQVRRNNLKGEEASYVLEREPSRVNTGEALALAAKLWREFGDKQQATSVGQLAEKLLSGDQVAKKERPDDAGLRRIERLENAVSELTVGLRQIKHQLDDLQNRNDKKE